MQHRDIKITAGQHVISGITAASIGLIWSLVFLGVGEPARALYATFFIVGIGVCSFNIAREDL